MQEVLVSKIFNYTSTPTKNVEGQFWFNPSTNVLSRFNGTIWKPITVSSDDVAVLTDGSKVSLTSYLNTQIAALAEGIDSKQDKLETYKEKQGDRKINTTISSSASDDGGFTGDIIIHTNGVDDTDGAPHPGNITLSTGKSSGGGGNITLTTGDETDGSATGASLVLNKASNGGNINITAGSATGENSASGRIKLNVPDKSGIVIDKDFIELNYKGDTSTDPGYNEWKCYIGGSGSKETTDFNASKYSIIYLGNSDYATEINLGGGNSYATVNIGTTSGTNSINIGSGSDYDTLTLDCGTLSGRTFNTELTSTSDNNHIPTSKAVYDALTLKQNTLQFYTESITDAPGYSSGSGIYQEQISLGKSNYSQTINIGGNNYIQRINLGGGGNHSIITIGGTTSNNEIQIGRTDAFTALEINANTIDGNIIDKTALTESYNLPTSQAVLNGLSAKQNTTDNNLTTTDKTIVGAINELNSEVATNTTNIGILQTSLAGTLYFDKGKLSGYNFTIPTFPFSICATVRIDAWRSASEHSQPIFQYGQLGDGTGSLFALSFIDGESEPKLRLKIMDTIDGVDKGVLVNCALDLSTFLGKMHTIVGICRAVTAEVLNWDIYIDGVKQNIKSSVKNVVVDSLSGTRTWAVNTSNENFSSQPASTNPMMLRNLYIFNFDISAEGSPYSIADYEAGRLIPPALKPSQVSLALENYTITRNATTTLVKDASGNSNDATVRVLSGGYIAGDNDQSIKVFVDEIKTQINQSNG